MFIKEIKLSGFKSYKKECVLSELVKGLNIIIGRNGSGKSNIFSALEHVLSADLLRSKVELPMYGGQPGAKSYVEIVFDNEDGKLPIDAKTVYLRRSFNLKKNKLSVNDKELLDVDARKFLKAAGFTNPYYFVKQGKIHDLALATDAARYKAISEVIGANEYNEKITQCQKTIDDVENKRKEAVEYLEELNERKGELKAEVAEQQKYLKMDSEKRGIQYVLHQRTMQEIETRMEELENAREEMLRNQKPLLDELEHIQRDIQIHSRDLVESETKINSLQQSMKMYEESMNTLLSELARHKEELSDLRNQTMPPETSEDFSTLQGRIRNLEEEIAQKNNGVNELKNKLDQLHVEKCKMETHFTQDQILAARKMKSRMGVKEIEAEITQYKESLKKGADSVVELQKQVDIQSKLLETVRDNVSKVLGEITTVDKQLQHETLKAQSTKTELEALWNRKSETDEDYSQKRQRVRRLQDDWKKSIGFNTFLGCEGVEKVLKVFRDEGKHEVVAGYYGLACDLIENEPQLDIAVEVAAKKKLTYHVVESAVIAEAILQQFNKLKLPGQVNFIPLQRKQKKSAEPTGLNKAVLLKSLIKFDPKFAPIVDFVFGNTLLCETFEISAEFMKAYEVKCVTLDGDVISSSGVITGGYRSRRPRQLELKRAKENHEAEISEIRNQKDSLEIEIATLTEARDRSIQSLEKLRLQKSHIKNQKQGFVSNMKNLEMKLGRLMGDIKVWETQSFEVRAKIAVLEETERTLKSRKSTKQPGISELKDFLQIKEKYRSLKNQYETQLQEKGKLDVDLSNLQKKYYTALEETQSQSQTSVENEISRIHEQINSLNGQVKSWEQKLKETTKKLEIAKKHVKKTQDSLNTLKNKDSSVNEELRMSKTELEALASRISSWMDKRDEESSNEAEFANLPRDIDKYEEFDVKTLHKQLQKLNSKLKDPSSAGVNQKATEQYEEVKAKCAEFENQLDEYMKERENITEFLNDLNAKKGEAVLHNIGLIQKQFQEIFCSVVPQGNAELVFYGPDLSLENGWESNDNDLMEKVGSNALNSAKVMVNFVGKRLHHIRSLAQLSGGQKSVVALCIILAIQRIDPAPFYVFDEVDQALDERYRTAVANQIEELSETSQFICTTFRKELIDVAVKVFGVSIEKSSSRIQEITKDQAKNFVEEELPDSQETDSQEMAIDDDNAMYSPAA